jgi:diaminopimelate decarboxylase
MIYKYPLSKKETQEIIKKHPTPFHIYSEKEIKKNAKRLYKAFSWMPGFKNYFAVKANPNPFILKILKQARMGTDCSSLPELMLSEKSGIVGENIMFTSNDTPDEEFVKCIELGGIVNLDDISHIEFLEKAIGKLPELICFRYNPGPSRTGNVIIGDPKEAKYGLTKEQLFEAYKICIEKGVKRFGLHTMIASNELNGNYHIETARMLMELVVEVNSKLGIKIEFINLGGGYGIPYKPEEKEIDIESVSNSIKKIYEELIVKNNLDPLKIIMESGRMILGPYGWLVSSVRHLKHIYKDYVGLDSCMTNLMRPALYGAYHHITVLGKENDALDCTYDVTGSLCENNDKFAIDRQLPCINVSDLIVLHNSGAHGHAMGFNYNGKLRSCELLLRENGTIVEIRRSETVEDYFSTLDFSKLDSFE